MNGQNDSVSTQPVTEQPVMPPPTPERRDVVSVTIHMNRSNGNWGATDGTPIMTGQLVVLTGQEEAARRICSEISNNASRIGLRVRMDQRTEDVPVPAVVVQEQTTVTVPDLDALLDIFEQRVKENVVENVNKIKDRITCLMGDALTTRAVDGHTRQKAAKKAAKKAVIKQADKKAAVKKAAKKAAKKAPARRR